MKLIKCPTCLKEWIEASDLDGACNRCLCGGYDVETQSTDFKGKFNRHMKKYGFVYKVIGTTIIIFVAGGGFDYAFASSAIDREANKLYMEILNVGKWVIIFKGGIDTIKAIGNGDFDTAKKSFFSYLLVYLMLLGLPYGMDKVDQLFTGLKEV